MRAISSTSAGVTARIKCSSPDDHFMASPDRRVTISAIGHVNGAGSGPGIRAGIVSISGIKIMVKASLTSPDDHFIRGPNRCVTTSRLWRISGRRCCPAIGVWIIFSTSVQVLIGNPIVKITSPNDHLITSPHCLRARSASRRIGCARGYPGIRAGIVSAAGCIEKRASPHDHFTASPDCYVRISFARCTDSGSGRPTVHHWIVVTACI